MNNAQKIEVLELLDSVIRGASWYTDDGGQCVDYVNLRNNIKDLIGSHRDNDSLSNGYYHVKISKFGWTNEQTVGRFNGKIWRLIGYDANFLPDEITVISRIND